MLHFLAFFLLENDIKLIWKTYQASAVVCLRLLAAEYNSHSRNASRTLSLYIARYDEQFVELLAFGH